LIEYESAYSASIASRYEAEIFGSPCPSTMRNAVGGTETISGFLEAA
jgi:hypothetical protein